MRYLSVILSLMMIFSPAYAQGACGLESRFEAGSAGRVTPGDANNVRDTPTRHGVLVGQIEAGQVFGVVGESRCAEDLTWVQVEFVDEGEIRTGWTVEGSPDRYFVDPLEGEFISFVDDGISVSLVLPKAVATGVEFTFYEEIPEIADEPFTGYPAYYEINFSEGYLDEQVHDGFDAPLITLYAADEFGRLQDLLENEPDLATFDVTGENRLPDFTRGAAPMLLALLDYRDFITNRGISFLTYYAQDYVTATNNSMVYRYQGITTDDAYFVNGWFPIDAPVLPGEFDFYAASESDDVTAAFEQFADDNAVFFEEIPLDMYMPNLEALDALIASLWIE